MTSGIRWRDSEERLPNGSKFGCGVAHETCTWDEGNLQSLVVHASAVAPSTHICAPIIFVYLFKYIL